MVTTLFTTDVVYAGLLTCAISASTVLGQCVGSGLTVLGGHSKEKMMGATCGMTAFIGAMAAAGESKAIATALVCMGSLSVGLLEGVANGVVTVVVDPKEIGVAVGTFTSLRTVGGMIASKSHPSSLLLFIRLAFSHFRDLLQPYRSSFFAKTQSNDKS